MINVKDGDFIEIEYVGKVKETNEIFDLTDEKTAKENNIYNPKVKYGPVSIIIGGGFVIKGLENEIKKMKAGEKKDVEIAPKDAFGERNANLMKLFSLNEFKKQGVMPVPGKYMDFGQGMRGKVLSVAGGRVRVDFNHPLSGKTLRYNVKISRLIEEKKEKIAAVSNFYIAGESKIDINGESAKITLSNSRNVTTEIKKLVADTITKYVDGIKDVEFAEVFKKAEEKEQQKASKA